jgi:hypothetical protein
MKVQKLPAVAGFIWINAGFRLLFSHFGDISKMILTYVFGVFLFAYLTVMLAQLGGDFGVPEGVFEEILIFLGVIFSPTLSIGFMQACRDTLKGEPVTPLHLLRGFQLERRALLSLLGLGLFQCAALAVISAFLPDLPKFNWQDLTGANPPPPEDPKQTLLRTAGMVAYLGVTLTVWYAPMLAAWNQMRAAKAMFYSLAACWRNRGAFLMFGVGWMLVCMFMIGVFSILATLLGDNGGTAALIAVLGLLCAGAIYCSVYVTYSSVFVEPAGQSS